MKSSILGSVGKWMTPIGVQTFSMRHVERHVVLKHRYARNQPFNQAIPLNKSPRSLKLGKVTVRASSSAPIDELPKNLKDIVGAFQAVPDPMQRYKQLLFFATKLEPMPAEEHNQENKVKGCVSQVWVSPRFEKETGLVYWSADSDSQLTKGLAALLVNGLSGCTPEEIVRLQPDFIAALGLQQSLTPSRNNGFLNMFKLMQSKALEIYMKDVQGKTEESSNMSIETSSGNSENMGINNVSKEDSKTPENGTSRTPVADSIRQKLEKELSPKKLDIIDESGRHAGHADRMEAGSGSAPGSGETHFVVEIVSDKFEGLSSLKRHRLVFGILEEEMAGPVHAMSLITKSPSEAGL